MAGHPIHGELLSGSDLYRTVVLDRMAGARESVWIATANVKAMMVEQGGRFAPVLSLFRTLARRGVELRLLHAELPSRPFRTAFDRSRTLVEGGLQLKICPRVHFKCVRVDGAWVYLGSANLTGAGLGAKHPRRTELRARPGDRGLRHRGPGDGALRVGVVGGGVRAMPAAVGVSRSDRAARAATGEERRHPPRAGASPAAALRTRSAMLPAMRCASRRSRR